MKTIVGLSLASVFVTFSITEAVINYRPYISTNLAKVIMAEDEEIIEEKCDGSGWITHGDGHKTECPGCSACKDESPKPTPDPMPEPKPDNPEVRYRCKCDTRKTYCNCVAAYGKCGCKKTVIKEIDFQSAIPLLKHLRPDVEKEPISHAEEEDYYIYHFGAKWCPPCEQMKKQTWESKRVKEAIDETRAKLFIFDEATDEHKKYFLYYKVKLYPTVIFVSKDDLNNPMYRQSGFIDANEMTKTIKEEFKDE